jgi:hypothetical protein
MLDPTLPLTLIVTAIPPPHDSVAIPLVDLELPFVMVATCPHKLSPPVLAVLPVLPVINVVFVLPLASTLLQSVFKLADVLRAVRPSVLAESFRFSFLVLACVRISIIEKVSSIPMTAVVDPLALVPVAIRPNMNTVPLRLAINPLPNVRLVVNSLPYPIPTFQPHFPFTIINLTIFPVVNTLSLSLATLV